MSDQRDGGISWTDETWNPVRGCSRVSAGCDNCYAMLVAHRFNGPGLPYEELATIRNGKPDWKGVTAEVPKHLFDPLRWRRPRRIFVNSMSDMFHPSISNEYIAACFGVMAAAPHHTFQVLTKRPLAAKKWFDWAYDQRCHGNTTTEIMRGHALDRGAFRAPDGSMPKGIGRMLQGFDSRWPLPNVWLGVSTEDQNAADIRIPELLNLPAAVRFISAEPLLGPLALQLEWLAPFKDTDAMLTRTPRIDWVIAGGESGDGARPCDVNWIADIVQDCQRAETAVFVKQLGAKPFSSELREQGYALTLKSPKGGDITEWPEGLRIQEFPNARTT